MSTANIDFRTMPANVPSLCIPRVFPNIDERRIRDTFNALDMGEIARVDIVRKKTEKGENFNRVFIHWKRWNESENANRSRERLLNGKEIKIIYDDPWFWKISAYRESTTSKPVSSSRPIAPRLDFDEDRRQQDDRRPQQKYDNRRQQDDRRPQDNRIPQQKYDNRRPQQDDRRPQQNDRRPQHDRRPQQNDRRSQQNDRRQQQDDKRQQQNDRRPEDEQVNQDIPSTPNCSPPRPERTEETQQQINTPDTKLDYSGVLPQKKLNFKKPIKKPVVVVEEEK